MGSVLVQLAEDMKRIYYSIQLSTVIVPEVDRLFECQENFEEDLLWGSY